MSFNIQRNFFCENCRYCGTRPVIEQRKTVWTVRCPNQACKNSVVDSFINVEKWNYANSKANLGKVISAKFKHTA